MAEYRHIRTDQHAQKVARELGVSLVKSDGVWMASAEGRCNWASRPVYAMRQWLADRPVHG